MPDLETPTAVPRAPLALLLTVAFFVSPLLFFTDLTRNPYYLQITLLNVSILWAAVLFLWRSIKRGAWLLPVSALSRPLGALGLVYLASFVLSWFGHAAFYRPAMASEGLKTGMFFLVNCLAVLYLSLSVPFSAKEGVSAGKWLTFILVWGMLWFLFPLLRTDPAGSGVLDRLLDPYGSLLWAGGVAAVFLLVKRCRQEDILHLAMTAGALASLYGILEFFHVELIWAKLLNPYGNRSVSTFGNPNFISSYIVIFLPLAVSLLMQAGTKVKRFYYGLVLLSYEGMLLCSLTRSSWIGAAAALGFLFSFSSHREKLKANRNFLYPFFAAALVLLFIWPADNLKPMSSSFVERVSEAAEGIRSPAAVSLSGDNGRIYSSFHQRLLIWTSAWEMGLNNPLTGNGWGQFELFYPFYQGRLMLNFPVMRSLRTHANNAHNELLEQWSQTGLIGLGVYLWFLAALFYGFLRFYRSSPAEGRYDCVPLAAGLAGVLIDNLLNVSIHFAVPALAFWWVAGALALRTSGTASRPAWRHPRASAAAAWVLIACCLAGTLFWQRQFMRELYYFDGFKAMRTGNVREAADDLLTAWKWHSREVNSNYEMGNAYVRAGDLDKGVWAYGEALKSNAGYDEIYFNLAVVLKRQGRLQEALKDLQVSSIINPLSPTTWQAMAEIYLSLPDKAAAAQAAIQDFREAVRVFPNDGNMWNTLGYFYTLTGDMAGARAAYASGVKAAPENSMLVENLTGISRKLGIKNDPDLAWLAAYSALTRELAAPAPSPRALDEADALLRMSPGNLKAMTLKAKLLFKAGRLDEAASGLKTVLDANERDNMARYGLAVIYEKQGNIPAARSEWETFLQFEPDNAAAAARLKALGGGNQH
jgi:Flp pilus assembly protein TadD/O-antigen ligase